MTPTDTTPAPAGRFPEIVAPRFREAAESLLAGIVDIINDAVVAVDDAQRVIVFNRGAQQMFGYAADEILGQPLARLIPPEGRAWHDVLVTEFAQESRPSRRMGERRTIHGLRADGSRFPAGATIARMEGDFGRVFVAIVRDISEHVETRERLRASLEEQEQLARTDPLTGLWNMRAFDQALEQELARLRRNGQPFTLVYLDLDRFKPVNDRHGHAFGDGLIRETARRLQQYFRAMDTVARIGGDEFVVLSPDSDGAAMHARLEQLRERIRQDMRHHGVDVTASIGVLTCATAPDSPAACLDAADRLMYRAKHDTGDTIACGVHDTAAQPGSDDA